MTPRSVALTGATGFLGRRLIRRLKADGFEVRALVRRQITDWGDAPPDREILGDLADAEALRRLVEGSETVVHAAGLIKALERRGFMAVNADGSEAVARAAEGRPLVVVSSLVARAPHLSDYAASKRAGEAAALAASQGPVTIIRPPAIYGAGDRETLGLFRLGARSLAMPIPNAPSARFALADADDVCGVISHAVSAPLPGTVAVGGARPEGYAWAEIARAAAAAFGRAPTLLPFPAAALSLGGGVSEGFARLRGRAAIFTRGKAREILDGQWGVSTDELGWTADLPFVTLEEGFARTAKWYRQAGWLP